MNDKRLWDCIIIGAGPAGLTAALYLARYRRKVLVFDNRDSRALNIPISHNYPGFPQGIAGKDLLERLTQQVLNYEVNFIYQLVESLEHLDQYHFAVLTEKEHFYSKTVMLCTGVKDIEPQLGNINDGIKRGLIRHCPVCDAFEIINKKIAVIGEGKKGLMEAVFLNNYSSDITLLTLGAINPWSRMKWKQLNEFNIKLITEEVTKINLSYEQAEIIFSNGAVMKFDCIYSALGCINHNNLANKVDAKQKEGRLLVNNKQQTSIPGLYAAGDIVFGLNQICVAAAGAAIAATAIHHLLNKI